MERKWYVLARSDQCREEPSDIFIAGMSDIELLHFGLEIRKVMGKVKIERESRGI